MDRISMPGDEAIGERLKVAVRQTWPSQKALARHLGITERALTRYMHGRIPRGDEMVKLALALPGQIEWILTGKGQQPSKPRADIRVMRERCRELLEQMPEAVVEGLVYHLERTLHWAKTGDQGVEAFMRRIRGDAPVARGDDP